MSETETNPEAPLFVNRKASTFIARKEGIFMKKGGEEMNIIPEKKEDDVATSQETSKPDRSVEAPKPKSPGMDPGASANIDKIRDLIFGNQMHDYEKRFSRLEERMFKEMTVSKSEARENFDSLEKYINKEMETLKDKVMTEQNARSESLRTIERQLEDINRASKDQVAAEQDARSEAVKNLERQLNDLSRSLVKRIGKQEDQLERGANDLRMEMSEQSQNLRADIRQKYEETASSIERVAQELRMSKADRTSLADFFSEMAMRLSNET